MIIICYTEIKSAVWHGMQIRRRQVIQIWMSSPLPSKCNFQSTARGRIQSFHSLYIEPFFIRMSIPVSSPRLA